MKITPSHRAKSHHVAEQLDLSFQQALGGFLLLCEFEEITDEDRPAVLDYCFGTIASAVDETTAVLVRVGWLVELDEEDQQPMVHVLRVITS